MRNAVNVVKNNGLSVFQWRCVIEQILIEHIVSASHLHHYAGFFSARPSLKDMKYIRTLRQEMRDFHVFLGPAVLSLGFVRACACLCVF